jgi:hypothetical protein
MATRQKIQLGVIVAIIGLILTLATNLVAYARSDAEQRKDIDFAKREIEMMRPKVEKIGVIENDVDHIKKKVDGMDIKLDALLMKGP